jgi:hypothetical protein
MVKRVKERQTNGKEGGKGHIIRAACSAVEV